MIRHLTISLLVNQTQKIETSTVTKTLTISTTEITETDIRNQTMSSMV